LFSSKCGVQPSQVLTIRRGFRTKKLLQVVEIGTAESTDELHQAAEQISVMMPTKQKATQTEVGPD